MSANNLTTPQLSLLAAALRKRLGNDPIPFGDLPGGNSTERRTALLELQQAGLADITYGRGWHLTPTTNLGRNDAMTTAMKPCSHPAGKEAEYGKLADAAFARLAAAAHTDTTVTYSDLWSFIQVITGGVPVGQPGWRAVAGVLGMVAERCADQGIPQLPAFAVSKVTGEVSKGYGYSMSLSGHVMADMKEHAVAERRRCIAYFQVAVE